MAAGDARTVRAQPSSRPRTSLVGKARLLTTLIFFPPPINRRLTRINGIPFTPFPISAGKSKDSDGMEGQSANPADTGTLLDSVPSRSTQRMTTTVPGGRVYGVSGHMRFDQDNDRPAMP
ncbi:hypothetical protein GCM10010211_27100 [Streptomyces albospinus]|uniref:Uncharacterized protein n=1 Tax=Streptomyces albospinus TaxID=285515 RepID=A0ABQ2UZ38_9ACTN|nr:hypothetical protein GCM10010211_27100 [Streptomyces albospinus]